MTRVDLARVSDIPSGVPSIPLFAKESGSQSFTTGLVDLAGATISATPSVTETWLVHAVFDINWTTASAGTIAIGTFVISGTATASAVGFAVYGGVAINRATVAAAARWTGVDAAAHTVKLQIQKSGAGGAVTTAGGSVISLIRIPE